MYNDFWLQYRTNLPENISHNPNNNSPFQIKQLGINEFEISIQLDFKRLKHKSSSNKQQNISVRIRGTKHCIFDNDNNSKLTQSNVRVNYFKTDESRSRTNLVLIESLHYDYESNKNSLLNHPIFHCQSCNDYVNDDFFGRHCTVTNTRKNVHQHLRIPTANMDMISVLLSIAADHFTSNEFKKVLKVYDDGDWHNKFPHISHHPNGFDPKNCYRSRSWYIGE